MSGQTLTVWRTVETEVEVAVELTPEEISQAFPRQGISVALGYGEGDYSRINRLIDEAEFSLRRLPEIPREVADLFWHLHGRALA